MLAGAGGADPCDKSMRQFSYPAKKTSEGSSVRKGKGYLVAACFVGLVGPHSSLALTALMVKKGLYVQE